MEMNVGLQEPEQVPTASVKLSEAEQKMFVAASSSSSAVFAGVAYWINPIIPQDQIGVLKKLLASGGAKSVAESGTTTKQNGILVRALPQMVNHVARFPLTMDSVTHIISPTAHFGEYEAAVRLGIKVVTPQWVERSFKFGLRYLEQYFSPSARSLFSGMVVAVTQVPLADKERIMASVMELGGQWREKLRPDITHLVVMKDDGPRCEYVRKNPELGIRMILPHWFMETLNLLRTVPQDPYLFPNPPMLENKVQRSDKTESNSATNATTNGTTKTPYDLPKPLHPFLDGYTVGIDTQLQELLSKDAVAQLTQRLTEAGAQVSRLKDKSAESSLSSIADWDKLDMLLCQHRTGYDYSKATRLGKMVGTLVWLYEMMINSRIVPPTQRLVHYPAPCVVAPGMDRLVVSVSGYSGAARAFVRRLLVAMGARYTPTLTRENTHLIAAVSTGRKFQAALEWDINIVNHLWVEHSYQRWKALAASHPIFTYYPHLPVLNAVVGDTEIDVHELKQWVETPPRAQTMAEWSDMDLLNDSDLETTAEAVDNGKEEEDNEKEKEVADSSSAEDGEEMAKRHTSRAAAMAASKSLVTLMQAVNAFEDDMRKEKRLIQRHKPQRTAEGEQEDENGSKKRITTSHGKKSASTAKRQRTVEHVRIIFTSLRPTSEQQQQILAMNGEIVDDPLLATHLVSKEVRRTMKLLMALASGQVDIVSPRWLEASLEERRWVSIEENEEYKLVDREAEHKWRFHLDESIQRAHKKRLFEGITFFITPKAEPPLNILRTLVEVAGGEAVDSLPEPKLKSLINASNRILHKRHKKSHDKDDKEVPPLVVVSCKEDEHMWSRFKSSNGDPVCIYSTEIILTGLLRQQIWQQPEEFGVRE